MPTIEWICGENGYEVSSPEHLIQIMTYGTTYEYTGKKPAAYWSAKYIQTKDIDLSGYENIKVMGNSRTPFSGVYDGGSFKISNWAFKSKEEKHVGLFGYTKGATIKHIRMEGNCYLAGIGESGGFIIGHSQDSTIYDIVTEFGDNTGIYWEEGNCGGLFGYVDGSFIEGCTMQGSLDMTQHEIGTRGGVIGAMNKSSITFVRNCCRFPNGIVSKEGTSGGICGHSINTESSILVNAMVGSIHGNVSGGIFGILEADPVVLHRHVNSMYGNISGNIAGGIYGRAVFSNGLTKMTDFVNYMGGSIKTESEMSAGMIGELSSLDGTFSLTNSVCAMMGFVLFAVLGKVPFDHEEISVFVDQTFGIKYEYNEYEMEFELKDFERSEELKGLWYCHIYHKGEEDMFYDADFVCANVGQVLDERYSHASLHKGDVSSPFTLEVEMENYEKVHLTYTQYSTKSMYTDPGLKLLSTTSRVVYDYDGYNVLLGTPSGSFTINTRPINIMVFINEVPGASIYKLTYQKGNGREKVWFEDVEVVDPEVNVSPLKSETMYTLRLYTSQTVGGIYDMRELVQTTTLHSSASNFNKNDFMTSNNDFDMSLLDEESRSELSSILKDVFSTGDKLTVKLKRGRNANISFINIGETLVIGSFSAILFPFDTSNGPGQSSSMILSDNSTSVDVFYNEVDGTISIGGTSYEVGEYFLLDGKKVYIEES